MVGSGMEDDNSILDEMLGPIEDVMKDLQEKWREMNEQEPLWSVIGGFIHAIDWQEPWLLGTLAFEFMLILIAILTRKRSGIQAVIFFTAAGIVYLAENLNDLGQKHWDKFAGQNYFDGHGIFFSAVISGPLLMVIFIVLINYLVACASLLVQAKRQEFKYKAQQKARQEKKSTTETSRKDKKDS